MKRCAGPSRFSRHRPRERGVDELAERFMEHRDKLRAMELRTMVKARLPHGTAEHLVVDVLHSTFAGAASQLDSYTSNPSLPILHRLRSLTLWHLGT